MGSHHKRNEGLKPLRRTAAKPKPERKAKVIERDENALKVLSIQQLFLDHIASLFHPVLSEDNYERKLQEIKGHFFRREYASVFSNPESCIAYSARYLPSRSLAYAELFAERPILDLLYPEPPARRPSERIHKLVLPRKRVVAVGAGVGSELCALHLLDQVSRSRLDGEDEDLIAVLNHDMQIDIIDSAEYETFLHGLNNHLAHKFEHRLSTQDELQPRLHFQYHKHDILKWSSSPEFAKLLADTTLLTFMFVFNELFAASKAATMQLITVIARELLPGSHVLLVESAGDLSQVKIERKQVSNGYLVREGGFEDSQQESSSDQEQTGLMVYKFWDHLPGFEVVMSEDRKWYRLDPSLSYPLEMENVGYFVRLYRKIA